MVGFRLQGFYAAMTRLLGFCRLRALFGRSFRGVEGGGGMQDPAFGTAGVGERGDAGSVDSAWHHLVAGRARFLLIQSRIDGCFLLYILRVLGAV